MTNTDLSYFMTTSCKHEKEKNRVFTYFGSQLEVSSHRLYVGDRNIEHWNLKITFYLK